MSVNEDVVSSVEGVAGAAQTQNSDNPCPPTTSITRNQGCGEAIDIKTNMKAEAELIEAGAARVKEAVGMATPGKRHTTTSREDITS